MTLPLFVAGLILSLAGSHWFSGAGTVGTILWIVGAVGLVIQLGILAVVAIAAWFATK